MEQADGQRGQERTGRKERGRTGRVNSNLGAHNPQPHALVPFSLSSVWVGLRALHGAQPSFRADLPPNSLQGIRAALPACISSFPAGTFSFLFFIILCIQGGNQDVVGPLAGVDAASPDTSCAAGASSPRTFFLSQSSSAQMAFSGPRVRPPPSPEPPFNGFARLTLIVFPNSSERCMLSCAAKASAGKSNSINPNPR